MSTNSPKTPSSGSKRLTRGFLAASLADEAAVTPKFQRARSKSRDRKTASKKSPNSTLTNSATPASTTASDPESQKRKSKRSWRGRGRLQSKAVATEAEETPAFSKSSSRRRHPSNDEGRPPSARSLSPQKLRKGNVLTPVLTPVVKGIRRLSRSGVQSTSPRRSRRSHRTTRSERNAPPASLPLSPDMEASTNMISQSPPKGTDFASFFAKTKKQRPGLVDETGSRLLPPSGRDIVSVTDDGFSLLDDGDDDEDDHNDDNGHDYPDSRSNDPAQFTLKSPNPQDWIQRNMPPVKARKSPTTVEAPVTPVATKSLPPSGSSKGSDPPPRSSSDNAKEPKSRRTKRGVEDHDATRPTPESDAQPASASTSLLARGATPNSRNNPRVRASTTSRRAFAETLSRAVAGRESNAPGNTTSTNNKERRDRSSRDDPERRRSRREAASTSPGRKRSKSRQSSKRRSKSSSRPASTESPPTSGHSSTSKPSSSRRSKDRSSSLDPSRIRSSNEDEMMSPPGRPQRRHSAPNPDEARSRLLSPTEDNKSKVRRGRKTPQQQHASTSRQQSEERHNDKRSSSSRSLSRSRRSTKVSGGGNADATKPDSARSHSSGDGRKSPEDPGTPSQRRSDSVRRRGRTNSDTSKPTSRRSKSREDQAAARSSPVSAKKPSSTRSLSQSRRGKRRTNTPTNDKSSSTRSESPMSDMSKPHSQSSVLSAVAGDKPKKPSSDRSSDRTSRPQSPRRPRLDEALQADKGEDAEEIDFGASPEQRHNLDKQSLQQVEKLKDEIKQMRTQRRKVKFGAGGAAASGEETPAATTETKRAVSDSFATTKSPSSAKARTYSVPLTPSLGSPGSTAGGSSVATPSRNTPKPTKSDLSLSRSKNESSPDFNKSIGAISIEDLDVSFFKAVSPKVQPAPKEDKYAALHKKIKKTKKLIKRTTREVWGERDEIVNFQRKNWSMRKALVQADPPTDSVTSLNMKIEKLLRTEREIDEDMDRIQVEKDSLETKCGGITKAINTYKELLDKLNKQIVPLLPPKDLPPQPNLDESATSSTLHFSPEGKRGTLGRAVSDAASLDDTLHSTEGDEDGEDAPFSPVSPRPMTTT